MLIYHIVDKSSLILHQIFEKHKIENIFEIESSFLILIFIKYVGKRIFLYPIISKKLSYIKNALVNPLWYMKILKKILKNRLGTP